MSSALSYMLKILHNADATYSTPATDGAQTLILWVKRLRRDRAMPSYVFVSYAILCITGLTT